MEIWSSEDLISDGKSKAGGYDEIAPTIYNLLRDFDVSELRLQISDIPTIEVKINLPSYDDANEQHAAAKKATQAIYKYVDANIISRDFGEWIKDRYVREYLPWLKVGGLLIT